MLSGGEEGKGRGNKRRGGEGRGGRRKGEAEGRGRVAVADPESFQGSIEPPFFSSLLVRSLDKAAS
jgi:hypothetical protein